MSGASWAVPFLDWKAVTVPARALLLSLIGRRQAIYSPLGIGFFILKMGEGHLTRLLHKVEVQVNHAVHSTRPDVKAPACARWSLSSRGVPLPPNWERAECPISGE